MTELLNDKELIALQIEICTHIIRYINSGIASETDENLISELKNDLRRYELLKELCEKAGRSRAQIKFKDEPITKKDFIQKKAKLIASQKMAEKKESSEKYTYDFKKGFNAGLEVADMILKRDVLL